MIVLTTCAAGLAVLALWRAMGDEYGAVDGEAVSRANVLAELCEIELHRPECIVSTADDIFARHGQ